MHKRLFQVSYEVYDMIAGYDFTSYTDSTKDDCIISFCFIVSSYFDSTKVMIGYDFTLSCHHILTVLKIIGGYNFALSYCILSLHWRN